MVEYDDILTQLENIFSNYEENGQSENSETNSPQNIFESILNGNLHMQES